MRLFKKCITKEIINLRKDTNNFFIVPSSSTSIMLVTKNKIKLQSDLRGCDLLIL